MNILKTTTHSARFLQKRGISALKSRVVSNKLAVRLYSTSQHEAPKEGSNVPWAIGSLLVFGPILFKLTSPPPSKKKAAVEQHVEHVQPVEKEKKEEPVEVAVTVVKKVQKPYVLVGAGTASFAAAQAIKEKDPQANVNRVFLFTKNNNNNEN